MSAPVRWCRALLLAQLLVGPGSRLASGQESIEYYGTDAIGSVRIVFDASAAVKGRMDFGPFGEELQQGSGVGDAVFAQLFRDGETGTDAASARSYSRRSGRFITPDSFLFGAFDPQGWNRYAYVTNRPTVFTDPSGLLPIQIVCGVSDLKEDPRTASLCLQHLSNEPPPAIVRAADGSRGPGGAGRTQPNPPSAPTSPNDPTPNPEPDPPTPSPKEKDCTRSGVARFLPDYTHTQFSVAIPNGVTGTVVGITVSVALDRYGNAYVGIGPAIGRTAPIAAVSTTVGYLEGERTQARTRALLSGWSGSAGLGVFWGAYNRVWNNSGRANEWGVSTPQAGYSGTYSWMTAGGSSCR